MHNLDQIQRWMQTVIMSQGGAGAGVASASARKIIDVAPEDVERVVTPSRALSGLERLDIYHRAYFARLLDCLREEFPVLMHAVARLVLDPLITNIQASWVKLGSAGVRQCLSQPVSTSTALPRTSAAEKGSASMLRPASALRAFSYSGKHWIGATKPWRASSGLVSGRWPPSGSRLTAGR